jgi:Mrp family chromosome partitioning ATPase
VSSLGFALNQVGGKSVMITSSGPSDGKSATALNLAIAALADGRTPLLIDVDERARGLTRMSGYGIARGVTDADGETRSGELVQKWPVEGQTVVEFVPAGKRLSGGSAGYFRSAQFQETLPKLTEGYDLVIFDAPPVLVAAETTDIASNVDGVVLVVRRDTEVRDLEDARDRLAIAGTPILGYVFNWAKGADGRYGYGYGYGYGDDERKH